MNFSEYTIQAYGDQAILIQWKQAPSRALCTHLTAVKQFLENDLDVEVVLTYNELLLKGMSSDLISIEKVAIRLREKNIPIATQGQTRILHVPVCYDLNFGKDLSALALAKGLSIQQVIALHTLPEYLVYFMGFLPGFPYLLGLDTRLYTPRKATPSRQCVSGSVAIGGEQTGIYPQDSPGGWHVIGHCPIPLFDTAKKEGSLFRAGDVIKFQSISIQEHQAWTSKSIKEYLNSSYVVHG